MVPHDLDTYFEVAATLSGTFIGLLFVSITLRYDSIFEADRQRATASSAFVSLVVALIISLWALIPLVSVGYPTAVSGAVALVVTLRIHVGPGGRRDTSTVLFVASVVGQSSQTVVGAVLLALPHNRYLVDSITYVVFYAVLVGLLRAWQLLVPRRDTPIRSSAANSP